eukprot:283872-Prymnesium_polylepis.1
MPNSLVIEAGQGSPFPSESEPTAQTDHLSRLAILTACLPLPASGDATLARPQACQAAPDEFEGVVMRVEGEPDYMCDVERVLLRSEDGDLTEPRNIVLWPADGETPARAIVHLFPEFRRLGDEHDAGAFGRLMRWLLVGAGVAGLALFEAVHLVLGRDTGARHAHGAPGAPAVSLPISFGQVLGHVCADGGRRLLFQLSVPRQLVWHASHAGGS